MLNRLTPVVKNILLANVAVFILMMVEPIREILWQYFALFKTDLVIQHDPRLSGMFQPVQIVTHFFNHAGIMHIFFNMFIFALIGPGVEMVLGSERFLKFYLFCGVLGGILIALFDPSSGPVVGASGAIYGVMVAFALFFPREKFYLYFLVPIEARWLVIGVGIFSLFMVVRQFMGEPVGGNVSHFGHLAGMVAAISFFYLRRWLPFLQ